MEKEQLGLTGLSNIGNTCYLNSCMQVLSHTHELNDYLDSEQYANISVKNEDCLLVEWDNLRKLMWREDLIWSKNKNKNYTITPGRFVNAVRLISTKKGKVLFSGYNQNDVEEYLQFLINEFHEVISRKVKMSINGNVENDTDMLAKKCYETYKNFYENDYSEIINLFFGMSVSKLYSKSQKKIISLSPEPFFVLSIPIKETSRDSITLSECFEYYTQIETMDQDNKWLNEETSKYETIEKSVTFWSLPEILIIQLKRWNYNGEKNSINVETELENIDLSKYVEGYSKTSSIYNIYGICNHSGSSMGGHYTANVKCKNGDWYNFNDGIVKKIDESNAMSNKAYCLFLRKN